MKWYPFVALLLGLLVGGCESGPSGPPMFMGIASAHKIGSGPRETSQYTVKVHYENLLPENYEVKIGFGYIPNNKQMALSASDAGIYAVAHTEVIHSSNGDLVATIDPAVVKNLGSLDGKIWAILSPYPHGKEWKVLRHDVYALDPSE